MPVVGRLPLVNEAEELSVVHSEDRVLLDG